MPILVAIAVGGALGALLRYGLWVARWAPTAFRGGLALGICALVLGLALAGQLVQRT